MRKTGCPALQGISKLGLQDLLTTFLPGHSFAGKHIVIIWGTTTKYTHCNCSPQSSARCRGHGCLIYDHAATYLAGIHQIQEAYRAVIPLDIPKREEAECAVSDCPLWEKHHKGTCKTAHKTKDHPPDPGIVEQGGINQHPIQR